MIRYSVLTVVILYLCLYSFKDWYRALCYSLPILAVLERPDMPRSMLGIPGMNPFNILLVFILLGWLTQKQKEGLRWKIPPALNTWLLLYVIVVTISWFRMIVDPDGIFAHAHYFQQYGFSYACPDVVDLIRDDFFNAWKWLIPGLLICHGANSKERGHLAMQWVLITGLLLAVQIILRMWPALVGLDDLNKRSLRVFDRDIGYHKVQLATYMAGTSWGFFVYGKFCHAKRKKQLAYGCFAFTTIALMATGGRGGAVAWVGCALLFGLLKWRKILLVLPLCVALVFAVMPSAENRYLTGVKANEHERAMSESLGLNDAGGEDVYAMTSGRNIIWPRVIQYIKKAPIIGYGMRAYEREGVFESLHEDGYPFGIGFWSHPHNAYLMFLLDMGIVGLVILLMFYGTLVRWAMLVFRRFETDEYTRLVAAFCLAFVGTSLIDGLFACTFYPAQDNALEWCAIGLFLGTVGRKFRAGEPPDETLQKEHRI